VIPPGHIVVDPALYDFVPKGTYVFGPMERFLLIQKNRHRAVLLPGQETTGEAGVGWLTESNTPESYDLLWGSDAALEQFRNEAHGVRDRMPHEIIEHAGARLKTAASIIDVGCGTGDLLLAAKLKNPTAALSGCDFSSAAVAGAKTALPDADIRTVHIDRTLPYESDLFDVVLCTDVLEHLEHPTDIAAELVRICAPGGNVVIVVPDGDVDTFLGHLWFWNEERLAAMLAPWSARVWRLPDCREFIAIIEKER